MWHIRTPYAVTLFYGCATLFVFGPFLLLGETAQRTSPAVQSSVLGVATAQTSPDSSSVPSLGSITGPKYSRRLAHASLAEKRNQITETTATFSPSSQPVVQVQTLTSSSESESMRLVVQDNQGNTIGHELVVPVRSGDITIVNPREPGSYVLWLTIGSDEDYRLPFTIRRE